MSSGTVIYIGGFEMPDKNAAAHRVLNNAKIFKELGYHVVFCGVDKEKDASDYSVEKIGSFDSIPVKYPANAFEWMTALFDFSHVRRAIESYEDVKFIVSYNMHAKPLSKLFKYAKKRGVKLIADITEWYENRFSLNPVKAIKWFDTVMVMKKLHKKVNGIISISSYLSSYYAPFVDHIVQIPPLVDLSEDIWNPPQSIDVQTVEFVYAGFSGKDKDRINLIVDYFYDLKDLSFVFTILGVTREQFLTSYPGYETKIDALGSKIRFKGRVSHKCSVQNLYSADYCIFLRDRTRKNMAGFPTKFVECVTTGIGVIVNDFSNIKDYFPLNHSVLLDTIKREDLENAIKEKILEGKIVHTPSDIFDYSREISGMKRFLEGLERDGKGIQKTV